MRRILLQSLYVRYVTWILEPKTEALKLRVGGHASQHRSWLKRVQSLVILEHLKRKLTESRPM